MSTNPKPQNILWSFIQLFIYIIIFLGKFFFKFGTNVFLCNSLDKFVDQNNVYYHYGDYCPPKVWLLEPQGVIFEHIPLLSLAWASFTKLLGPFSSSFNYIFVKENVIQVLIVCYLVYILQIFSWISYLWSKLIKLGMTVNNGLINEYMVGFITMYKIGFLAYK